MAQQITIKLERKPRLAARKAGQDIADGKRGPAKPGEFVIAVRTKPFYIKIAKGLSLGYRANKGGGVWVVRKATTGGRNVPITFAEADDSAEADGVNVMSYGQALDRARVVAYGETGTTAVVTKAGRRITVAEACTKYETQLTVNGGRHENIRQLHSVFGFKKGKKDKHGHEGADTIPPLWHKAVADLTEDDMRGLRDAIVLRGNSPSSANRYGKVAKAALSMAAAGDKRITNQSAWLDGFATLTASEGRDECILLSPGMSGAIVQAAYAYEFGRQIGEKLHTLAETGTRESQMMRLRVRDLQQDDPNGASLAMPASFKGPNGRKVVKPATRLRISNALAGKLAQLCVGKSANDLIFEPGWQLSEHFKVIAARVGADRDAIPLSFRHSSIVRMLREKMDPVSVAKHHNTSVAMLEANYAKFILRQTADQAFATMPDFMAPLSDNVVPMVRKVG